MNRPVVVINQKVVQANIDNDRRDPPLSISDHNGQERAASEVVIRGQDGLVAAKIYYDPDLPLLCGCHVWVEMWGDFSSSDLGAYFDSETDEECVECKKAREIRNKRMAMSEVSQ